MLSCSSSKSLEEILFFGQGFFTGTENRFCFAERRPSFSGLSFRNPPITISMNEEFRTKGPGFF
jgi:hypothetical protein